jgi:hypothetical protein
LSGNIGLREAVNIDRSSFCLALIWPGEHLRMSSITTTWRPPMAATARIEIFEFPRYGGN